MTAKKCKYRPLYLNYGVDTLLLHVSYSTVNCRTLFCVILGEGDKRRRERVKLNAPGGKLSKFLKVWRLLLGHFHIIIKWT